LGKARGHILLGYDGEQEDGGEDGSDNDSDPGSNGSEAQNDSPKKGNKSIAADPRNYAIDASINISEDKGSEQQDPSPSKKRKRGEEAIDKEPPARKSKADTDEEKKVAEEQAPLFQKKWDEGEEEMDGEDEMDIGNE
jgi:hypothetical protein